jgi:hypothetical protein
MNEFLNKRYQKLKGQSRMDNPETLATFFGTQDEHKNTTQKTLSNMDPKSFSY